jgi:hypothetical protein
MIVRADPHNLIVITQPDHAGLAADLLAGWCLDSFAENPRCDDLLFACREHDNGWRETDSAPRRDENGRPVDFIHLAVGERIELWRRGTERYRSRRPYVALVLTQHAVALHEGRRGLEQYDSFLADMTKLRAELLEQCQLTIKELVADYRWIEIADALSLAICMRRENVAVANIRARAVESSLELEPFPFDGDWVVRLSYRRIPDRTYRSDADLGGELALAKWQTEDVTVRPFRGVTD